MKEKTLYIAGSAINFYNHNKSKSSKNCLHPIRRNRIVKFNKTSGDFCEMCGWEFDDYWMLNKKSCFVRSKNKKDLFFKPKI